MRKHIVLLALAVPLLMVSAQPALACCSPSGSGALTVYYSTYSAWVVYPCISVSVQAPAQCAYGLGAPGADGSGLGPFFGSIGSVNQVYVSYIPGLGTFQLSPTTSAYFEAQAPGLGFRAFVAPLSQPVVAGKTMSIGFDISPGPGADRDTFISDLKATTVAAAQAPFDGTWNNLRMVDTADLEVILGVTGGPSGGPVPPPAAAPSIPTLSAWALLLLVAGLSSAGLYMMRR